MFLISSFTTAHAQQYPHGIGSNSSALYNSLGLTYQQCQNKIADEIQKTIASLDRGKAVKIALEFPEFQSKVAGHKYELTDISTNDTWDNALCGNVKRTAVGVSFNLLDTPDSYLESVNVAEDANMSQVIQVGTTITPSCTNNCMPTSPPPLGSNFIPNIASDFHLAGVMVPNATIPVSIDLANERNSTLYNVHVAFVDSPLLQNFRTGYGNLTLRVGEEKTILGTMSSPSEISNVSSSLNWMIYANSQDGAAVSKEFHKIVNLADKSTWIDNSVSYRTILPPLKQDSPVNEIQCRQGYQLIIKSEDYSPACVTPTTNQTLVMRGWGESLKILSEPPAIKKMDIVGLQQNYAVGQPIHAALKYTGWSYEYMPEMKILNASGNQVWFNCPECVVHTEHATIYPGSFGTFTVNLQDYNGRPPVINQTGTYTIVASYENKTVQETFAVIQSGNNTLPASFEPCDTSYPQKYQGIPVLYMPANSTGKLCVRYHNLNDHPVPIGIRIFKAHNMSQDATDVTTWNDSGNNTIPKGNSTVVYWIKTGSHAGFYGLAIFCVPMPFAVGYDTNSTLVQSDFPWLGQSTWYCPAQYYDFHIDSTTGFDVRYFSWK